MITAAATIMILVFLSFLFGQQLIIDQFGVGLAGAVIVDAFLIRTVLVPAAMHLSGTPAGGCRAGWTGSCRSCRWTCPGRPPAVPAGLTGPDAVPADTTAP